MPIRPELSLRLPNSPGAVGAVCRILANERVNILALSLEASGHLRLIVDNHVLAAGALRADHRQVSQRDVLVLTIGNAAGALAPVLKLVTDAGINIEYAYGGATGGSAGAVVVLGVDDAQRAAAASGV